MMCRRRILAGLGLVEVLLALFVFSFVIVIISELVTGYGGLIRQSQGRARTIRSAQVALSQLRADVRTAVEVTDPAPGATSPKLTMLRINPRSVTRLPDPLPARRPSTWNPVAPAHTVPIEVRMEGDLLVRESAGVKYTLAKGVKAFTVTHTGTQYQVELTVNESKGDVLLFTRVSRP
jgi:Tfp pilus assembly protein PilW